MKKVKLTPPSYKYDEIKTDYGQSGLSSDFENEEGVPKLFYINISILVILLSIATVIVVVPTLYKGKKHVTIKQIETINMDVTKPAFFRVATPNTEMGRKLPIGTRVYVVSDSSLYIVTGGKERLPLLQDETINSAIKNNHIKIWR